MADDSELDYLDTFVTEVTTDLAVDTFETKRNVDLVSGAKKCLIYPPQLLWVDGKFYKKRYLVKISMATEALMTTMINELINGCILYNTTRSGLTSVSTMCNIHLVFTNKAFVATNGRWKQDIYMDVEWCSE